MVPTFTAQRKIERQSNFVSAVRLAIENTLRTAGPMLPVGCYTSETVLQRRTANTTIQLIE